MKLQLVALALLAVSAPCLAQDAVKTDGDKYKVLMKTAAFVYLSIETVPGQKTHQHHHPSFVLYALEPFERIIHLSDGKNINRAFKAGDVIWSPAQTHIGENVGSTATHAIIVESKPSGKAIPECIGK